MNPESFLTERELRRVVICGTRYSDNLGDGIIADCMGAMIQRHDPAIEVVELDLSGRTRYSEAGGPRKMAMQRVMFAAPKIFRPLIVSAALSVILPLKLRSRWRQALQNADLLIIGGGQLLQDEYLNFPIKVSGLMAEAAVHQVNTAVFSCGVGRKWSLAASLLLRRSFRYPNVFYQSARDKDSMGYLDAHLAGLNRQPTLWAPDPALWTARAFNYSTARSNNSPIGIGIAHPLVLKNTSEVPSAFQLNSVAQFWVELIKELDRRKHQLTLFTNGSEEDSRFLEVIAQSIADVALNHRPHVLPRARCASDLVCQIADFRGVVAHRLHANIVAFALGVPSVGLIWDSKVRGFFDLSGRSAWSIEADALSANHVANKLENALLAGIDEEKRLHLESTAYASLEELLASARCALGHETVNQRAHR